VFAAAVLILLVWVASILGLVRALSARQEP
jgi:hypothetical protein